MAVAPEPTRRILEPTGISAFKERVISEFRERSFKAGWEERPRGEGFE